MSTKDYNLIIKIQSPGTLEKLDARNKKNSVLFVDYSKIVEEIFQKFETDEQFNLFRFSLYTACQDFVKISKYHNGYRLESNEIFISQNLLAVCLPRELRRRYFKYDTFYEKRYLKEETNYHYL